MTQRDYIKFAAMLKQVREVIADNAASGGKITRSSMDTASKANSVVNTIEVMLCDILAEDNERFDRVIFNKASSL